MAQSEGKFFERDFIGSVSSEWFKYRLNDTSASWSNNGGANGGVNTSRFTPSNICDFIIYNGQLWLFELKSHKGKSIPLSCIRPKQLQGLLDAYKKGTQAGYIFNFRDVNETYYVDANMLNSYLVSCERKSIPLTWLQKAGKLIPQTRKKIRFNYDLEFMKVSV